MLTSVEGKQRRSTNPIVPEDLEGEFRGEVCRVGGLEEGSQMGMKKQGAEIGDGAHLNVVFY